MLDKILKMRGITNKVLSKTPLMNLVTNGDFSNGTTGWTAVSGATILAVDGTLKVVGTSTNLGRLIGFNQITPPQLTTNKYYLAFKFKPTVLDFNSLVYWDGSAAKIITLVETLFANVFNNVSTIYQAAVQNRTNLAVSIATSSPNNYDTFFDDFIMIDLTATFGAGSEPTVIEMDAILAKFPNNWFDGTVDMLDADSYYGDVGIAIPKLAVNSLKAKHTA